MTRESLNPTMAYDYKIESWKEWDKSICNNALQEPSEKLPRGTGLNRKDWVTLNRARTKVGRTGKNLHRWGLKPTSECSCGHPVQTMEHILGRTVNWAQESQMKTYSSAMTPHQSGFSPGVIRYDDDDFKGLVYYRKRQNKLLIIILMTIRRKK